jgi:branched-chain amino acid aminotransferase
MKPDIWYNGEFVAHDDAQIHVLSHVIHYGSSVFEGIRCYETEKGSAVFRLDEHMRRLEDSAKIHRMDIPYSRDELNAAVVDTIERSGLAECYIRPVVFRGEGPMGVNPLQNKVETFVAVWEWGTYLGEEALEEGVDVEVANWNRMAPNTHPALAKAGGNYLNASLVKMNAVKNDKMEGIMLSSDGYLAEGSGENLFVVRDDTLYTAPTGLSILPGITRDAIITLARKRGYEVVEKRLPREVLYIADELFFTGTAAEVTPIRTVDDYTIGDGSRGPVTKELQEAFFDVVHAGNDPHDWLTFVDVSAPEPATA